MKTTPEIENKLLELKPILSNRFGVSNIGFFGSYSKNQQNENSDLDLLVEFSKPIGWEFFTLEKFLEDNIGLKVDLVTPNALKSQLKESILNEVHYI